MRSGGGVRVDFFSVLAGEQFDAGGAEQYAACEQGQIFVAIHSKYLLLSDVIFICADGL